MRLQRYVACVEQVINYIRLDLRNKKLWITLDETKNEKNKVVNILACILIPSVPHVRSSKRVVKTLLK